MPAPPVVHSKICINVIDVAKGRISAKIHSSGTCQPQYREKAKGCQWVLKRQVSPLEQALGGEKFAAVMESISAVQYGQAARQVVTGLKNGDLVIWK